MGELLSYYYTAHLNAVECSIHWNGPSLRPALCVGVRFTLSGLIFQIMTSVLYMIPYLSYNNKIIRLTLSRISYYIRDGRLNRRLLKPYNKHTSVGRRQYFVC